MVLGDGKNLKSDNYLKIFIPDIIKANLCTKFHDRMPNGSAVRVLTDRHRRLCFYNLDR